VRQRCRRYGWEPFNVDEPQTVTTTGDHSEHIDTRLVTDTPAGIYIYLHCVAEIHTTKHASAIGLFATHTHTLRVKRGITTYV